MLIMERNETGINVLIELNNRAKRMHTGAHHSTSIILRFTLRVLGVFLVILSTEQGDVGGVGIFLTSE